MTSTPLVSLLPGAVPPPAEVPDQGVAWHYGDPLREQRELVAGRGAVDLSNRGVVQVSGIDRLSWLDSLTSQVLNPLAPHTSALSLILSPHGHVEHELHVVDDGVVTWLITVPGGAAELTRYLDSMRFMLRVEVADVTDEYGVVFEPVRALSADGAPTWLEPEWFAGLPTPEVGGDADRFVVERPGALVGREVLVPRADVAARVAASGAPAGTWALEALRVAAGIPMQGRDTDARTIPHEVAWVGPAVHLAKGCYRGQETVARVQNLGRPPRRLTLLHLDGSADTLPPVGTEVAIDGTSVGALGTAVQHYELGPIALAIVKMRAANDATVDVAGMRATQQLIVGLR
jgi:folate-binding protein YgfZ